MLELKEPAGKAGRVGGAVEIALVAGLDAVCLGFGAGEDQGGDTGMIQLRQGGAPAGGRSRCRAGGPGCRGRRLAGRRCRTRRSPGSCYAQLDNESGLAVAGGRTFNLAGCSRDGKAPNGW